MCALCEVCKQQIMYFYHLCEKMSVISLFLHHIQKVQFAFERLMLKIVKFCENRRFKIFIDVMH